MRFNSVISAIQVALHAGDLANIFQSPAAITGTRQSSLLAGADGLPPLPQPHEVSQTIGGLQTADIQGDILVGMMKQHELFYFFGIADPRAFKAALSSVASTVTTTPQLVNVSTQPVTALNLAFSASGLAALNTSGTIPGSTDGNFGPGQSVSATTLGDPGTQNWVRHFVGTKIHGVFLIASDNQANIRNEVISLESHFGKSMARIYALEGNIRPGAEKSHEHFGFLDGISQPAVTGFGTPKPGQLVVDPSVILVGATNDNSGNPKWMAGGAFLAFRQLAQRVPEFNHFLFENAIPEGKKTRQQAAELLGARMVGRWRSGAPVDLTPLNDDPALGADPNRNNNFTFAHPGFDEATDQTHCPFSAHIRKTHPRADLTAPTHSIMRAGIPYGPEVTARENQTHTTEHERGLAFVCYQSQLAQGFVFLQETWANNVNFIFGKANPPGFDPIIGANHGAARTASGMDINNPPRNLTMLFDFVVSRGGEYFFSPPISALTGILVK